MNPYVIEGGQAGKQRLRLLSSVLEPTTSRLFDRLDLRPGMVCLDAGCGGGDVTRHLADRVGPTGRVVGIDFDQDILRLAEAEAQHDRVSQVIYRWLDVEKLELAAEFDLVYARFLLSHLRAFRRALASLTEAARPGGWIVIEDVDFTGHFCYPECQAFDRYVELYQEVVRRKGADPTLGRKLPALLLEVGLTGVRLEVVQPTFREGPGKDLATVTMTRIGEAVVAEELASRSEVETIIAGLEAFARDERTVLSLPRIVQCWGRHPGD